MSTLDEISARDGLLPAPPLTVDESNALAGEGTIAAALAVTGWRFVYCEHGAIPAQDWHEHTHDHNQVGPDGDDVWAIERTADDVHDCILILDPALTEGSDRT